MPLAASSAALSAAAVPASGARSPDFTATPVFTAPSGVTVLATTCPSLASWSMSDWLRITTSQGSPATSWSRMAPTAPNSPRIVKPDCALKRSCNCATSPLAAPPLRIRTSCGMSVELDVRALDQLGPFRDVGMQVFVELGGFHRHRHRAILGPDLADVRVAGDL